MDLDLKKKKKKPSSNPVPDWRLRLRVRPVILPFSPVSQVIITCINENSQKSGEWKMNAGMNDTSANTVTCIHSPPEVHLGSLQLFILQAVMWQISCTVTWWACAEVSRTRIWTSICWVTGTCSCLFTRINKWFSEAFVTSHSPEPAVGWNSFLVTSWPAFTIITLLVLLIWKIWGHICVLVCFSDYWWGWASVHVFKDADF